MVSAGARDVWDPINITRDDRGCLMDEFVRTDSRGLSARLGRTAPERKTATLDPGGFVTTANHLLAARFHHED